MYHIFLHTILNIIFGLCFKKYIIYKKDIYYIHKYKEINYFYQEFFNLNPRNIIPAMSTLALMTGTR